MTNHFIDFRNADVILNMGGNVAENHPVSFKWIQAARDRGAIFIHVDPRFTRTSAKADLYVRLRSGTDIAFLGGMIKYILDNNLYDDFYLKNYTNAPFLVNPKYHFDDGLFSGYDPKNRGYDAATWSLEKDEKGIPKTDQTLTDERSVFQLLKKHYSRYTLEKVSEITGTPKKDLEEVYQPLFLHRKTGQGRDGLVCHGLDPAYGRGPEYSGHVDDPIVYWAIWVSPAEGSMPCGENPMSRDQPTRPYSFTSYPAIYRSRGPSGRPWPITTRPLQLPKTLEASIGGRTDPSTWPVF